MSTKVAEPCPLCGMPTLPEEKSVVYNTQHGDAPLRLWRYRCAREEPEWLWANAAQRRHNEGEQRRALKLARTRAWGG